MTLLALVAAACFPITGPYITARDVANAIPQFTPVDPSAVLGYAPMPGVTRVIHPAEAARFLTGQQFAGTLPNSDFCFERPVSAITGSAALQSMHQTLGPDARIEIVELSRFPAPSGELVFPREDLGSPPIALWRGYVRYDGDKKFPVWARVKIAVRAVRVMALEELKPGVPIKASQLAIETVDEFPGRHITPPGIAQAEGCIPRRFITANTPVWNDSIDPPNLIAKGDRVSVIVYSGRAQLTLDAEAENSGRLGDLVSFKNPESGKFFRARVQAPGKAEVDTPSITP